jgi:hypothetical protein
MLANALGTTLQIVHYTSKRKRESRSPPYSY